MLIFKKLSWKNFLSTGNVPIEVYLDKYNTTLISGDNGAGKSTILDALTFSLFGNSFRGISLSGRRKISNIVNTINEKDCVVEVEFSTNNHDYKVIRGLKPKIFEIYKDNRLIPQDANVLDYQKILEEQILKMSYKAFCQVVILGSSNYIPFMKLSAKDRRKIVEDLLDINVFSIMNTFLKSKVSENKSSLQTIINNIDLVQSKIDGHTRLIEKMEKKSKESIKNYEEELDRTNKQIEELTKEIGGYQEELEDLFESVKEENAVSEKLLRAESLEKKMMSNMKKVEREIDFYENNSTCPTCDQDITDSFKQEKVGVKKDKITELKSAVDKINDAISDTSKLLFDINNTLEKIKKVEKKISDSNSVVSACNKYSSKINNDVVEINKDKEDLNKEKETLKNLDEEHTGFDKQRQTLVEERTDLGVISSLLKDTGIKSKIIGYYLPIMNKLINHYLVSMDFFCQFTLDEGFDETIKSRYRDCLLYTSPSPRD